MFLCTALMMVARLEAQCIVFGAEGSLLTHELNPTAEFGLDRRAKNQQEPFDSLRGEWSSS